MGATVCTQTGTHRADLADFFRNKQHQLLACTCRDKRRKARPAISGRSACDSYTTDASRSGRDTRDLRAEPRRAHSSSPRSSPKSLWGPWCVTVTTIGRSVHPLGYCMLDRGGRNWASHRQTRRELHQHHQPRGCSSSWGPKGYVW